MTQSIIENLEITGLSHDGRGITHIDGKACFVSQTIPGDLVTVKITHNERSFLNAQLLKIQTASKDRREPFCDKYADCGGCQLQHQTIEAQRYWKTQNFFTQLNQQLNTEHCEFAPTLTTDDKGYRRRARLALEVDKKDKQARLGFRRSQDNRLVDIEQCPVLTAELNLAIAQARPQLLAEASRKTKELTIVDADNGVFGLTKNDQIPEYQIQVLDKPALTLNFPEDGFIQVNAQMNQQMIQQALSWLDLQSSHKVIDFFRGVGNFTLPLAQNAKHAVGVEGLDTLVSAADRNAQQNALDNCAFYKADLFQDIQHLPWFLGQKYDRVLLDPGRLGASELCKQLGELQANKIVYVSCIAATLIRDVKHLEKQGYLITQVGAMDMFPHTTHLEVMVLLEKNKKQKQQRQKRLERKKHVFKFWIIDTPYPNIYAQQGYVNFVIGKVCGLLIEPTRVNLKNNHKIYIPNSSKPC